MRTSDCFKRISNIAVTISCYFVIMSPPTIKILRSRTANNKLKSKQPPKEALREIIRRADADTEPKKRCKKQKGVRFGDIGGGELSSSMSLELDPAIPSSSAIQTRSIGQTCQPRTGQNSCQTISCIRCGELGHTAPLCTTADTSRGPPALYCSKCTLSYSYTEAATITIQLKTCLAHQRSPEKKNDPKLEAAARILRRIEDTVKNGTPLPDALHMMGIPHEKYNKIKIRVNP